MFKSYLVKILINFFFKCERKMNTFYKGYCRTLYIFMFKSYLFLFIIIFL
jgi:hypothetical protein